MIRQLLDMAILAAVVLGSVGYVGNGMLESRRGHGHPLLRWLRNAGILIGWPLLIARAFT